MILKLKARTPPGGRTGRTCVQKKYLTKNFVVSISAASLLKVVFRHFRVYARLCFPSNPSSASNFWKSVGTPAWRSLDVIANGV